MSREPVEPGRAWLTEAEGGWLQPEQTMEAAAAAQTPLASRVAPDRDGLVGSCVVSQDGRRLLVEGIHDEREVLVAVEVEESPDALRLCARLGVNPAAMPPVRHQREGYSFTVHFDIGWFWRRSVVLQAPLGTRPVLDVGSHDEPTR